MRSLLNMPQPSGKLARWGLALQELNLTILHHSGKHNGNTDALSRSPLSGSEEEQDVTAGVVAALASDGDGDASSTDSHDLSVRPLNWCIEPVNSPQPMSPHFLL